MGGKLAIGMAMRMEPGYALCMPIHIKLGCEDAPFLPGFAFGPRMETFFRPILRGKREEAFQEEG